MKITAIVPAAGEGLRFKSTIAKPLVNLDRRPILIHTLAVLSRHHLIKEIIVVFNKKDIGLLTKKIEQCKLRKIKKVVLGGVTRRQSVENGLREIDQGCDFVLIHDGVRPFIDKKIISSVIDAARKTGAALSAVPVKPTIKEVNPLNLKVKITLDRSLLWEIQTPQVFRKDIILKAYSRFKDKNALDDASLVEKLGVDVKVVEGSYKNIKITTPEDLVFAEAIIKNRRS